MVCKLLCKIICLSLSALTMCTVCATNAGKKSICPCSIDSSGGCQCQAPSRILKMQTIHHGAPVRAVSWLCNSACFDSPLFDLAAIGGYLSDFNAGPEGASVRVYEFSKLTEHFTLRDSVAPTSYIFTLDWCCIDGVAYLAVAGIPDHVTGNDVWIYAYNNATKKLDLVTSFAHGNTVYSVKWLCIDCNEYETYRFLAIGGEPAPDNIDIRLLSFDPMQQSLTIVNNRTHGGTIYALDWLIRENVRPVLVAGGVTVIDDCEKINLRIFAVDCFGSMNLINRGAYFPGGTVRTASWCNTSLPCASFPYTLAVGGNHEHHCDEPINVQIYSLKTSDCSLIPIPGLSLQQAGKVFAITWIPGTDCTYITIGGGCDHDSYCVNNIFSYKITVDKVSGTLSLELVSQSKFDEIITSLDWCQINGCSYLLVGSEDPFWNDLRKNMFCKAPDEIALYKSSFSRQSVGSPKPLCQRTIPIDD